MTGLARGWAPCALATVIVAANLAGHGWVMEASWLGPSRQPPSEGLAGKGQWGGRTREASRPPRALLDNDCYYWINNACWLADHGGWRVRYTHDDNVPYGREVHWNSGFAWWLLALGRLQAWWQDRYLNAAIADAAVWANPLLFSLVLVLAGWAVWRRRKGWAAGATVVLLSSLPSIMWDFGYGRPDHHGLHDAAALGLLLPLVLAGGGWVRAARSKPVAARGQGFEPLRLSQARWWFGFSGICAGLGLWVGATQQIFVIGSLGLAALAASAWLVPRGGRAGVVEQELVWAPQLWRLWGYSGAAVSLVCYLLEYFPDHLAMRLEVNHPLDALALAAGGELVCLVGRGRSGELAWTPRCAALTAALLGGVLALPAAMLLGPEDWHTWHDPYMRRLHDYILEFQPVLADLRAGAWQRHLRMYGSLPLLLAAAPILLLRKSTEPPSRTVILLPLVVALLLGAMTLVQARWSGLLSTALVCLGVAIGRVMAVERAAAGPRGRRTMILAGVLVLPSLGLCWLSYYQTWQMARAGMIQEVLAHTIACRDVAFNLRRYAGRGEVRAMSGPGETPALAYFGGGRGTGALYWENRQGIHDTADFFADYGEADARRIAAERGLTHVVAEETPMLAEYMHWVKYGTRELRDVQRTLAYRLSSPLGTPPEWLEPLPYYASPTATFYKLRIYRVRHDR